MIELWCIALASQKQLLYEFKNHFWKKDWPVYVYVLPCMHLGNFLPIWDSRVKNCFWLAIECADRDSDSLPISHFCGLPNVVTRRSNSSLGTCAGTFRIWILLLRLQKHRINHNRERKPNKMLQLYLDALLKLAFHYLCMFFNVQNLWMALQSLR